MSADHTPIRTPLEHNPTTSYQKVISCMVDQERQLRYRVHFGKTGALSYTSHLDLARVWERVLRRANIPLMYSQGFSPHPRIQIAAALPLGFASTAEYLDFWMTGEALNLVKIIPILLAASPPGLEIYNVEMVELKEPALQTLTHSASYHLVPGETINHEILEQQVDALLAQDKIIRQRRKKTYDLRPLIYQLRVMNEPVRLEAILALSSQQGTGRADELAEALELDVNQVKITRTAIHFTS